MKHGGKKILKKVMTSQLSTYAEATAEVGNPRGLGSCDVRYTPKNLRKICVHQ